MSLSPRPGLTSRVGADHVSCIFLVSFLGCHLLSWSVTGSRSSLFGFLVRLWSGRDFFGLVGGPLVSCFSHHFATGRLTAGAWVMCPVGANSLLSFLGKHLRWPWSWSGVPRSLLGDRSQTFFAWQ